MVEDDNDRDRICYKIRKFVAMRIKIKMLLAVLLIIRYIPHIISYFVTPIIREDVRYWCKCYGLKMNGFWGLLYFLTYYKEFRNVMYKRVKFSFLYSIFTPSILYILQPKRIK